MILKRNLLENLTILSTIGTVICVILNYITNISLITGVWLHLYICALFIVSVLCSFKCIQWLLRLNKPLKYDLEEIVKEYPYLAFLKRVLPEPRKRVPYVWKEYDTNELSVISTVLEKKLVSSWYVPYISQEIGFPFACKQMLDQMIGKSFKICNKIDSKDVFVDMCTIIITHLKEYKKALKRQEKSPTSTIESLYKMSHPISEANTKYTSADHCTNILRIIMKELLPWELWDTPHSELLVRILSKKLNIYIDNTLADPIWINDKLMMYLTGEEYKETEKVHEVKEEISKPDKNEMNVTPVVKNTEVFEEMNGQENVGKMENIVEEQALNTSTTAPLDVKSSPVLRQKRGRQGRNEVKIYDRIIEGSVKTWETDMDLQCISMGQDLLASLDGEITLSRLWGQDGEPEGSPERQGGKSPHPLWFGEEESPPPTASSPRPAVLKELQSSVSSAKTRIGDLQVVEASTSDEAAGMMEGLLDFGIAGLKKGLRFTGLSDDSQDKSPSHREKSDRTSPESRHRVYTDLGTNPHLQKDAENTNGATPPVLVKQHRVTSQDSVPVGKATVCSESPPLPSDSPEPQYEEAADLSTSIAKLRCLLRHQAHAPNSSRSDDIWWEGAEETRGRTQQHHWSRPVDTATLADEYDMNMERNSSPNQSSNNNMQRLDKLFQRTVTGVFNSLKTAVGGEEEAAPPSPAWTYVCSNVELGAGHAAARLHAARRNLTHVDAAMDSLHLPSRCLADRSPPDTDDLEEWAGACARAWSGAVGAACAVRPATHVAVRLGTVLLADVVENLITIWLEEVTAWLRGQVFAAFSEAEGPPVAPPSSSRRPLDLPRTVSLLLARAPALQILLGGESVRESVRVACESFTHSHINRDVGYRAADLLALHFTRAAALGGRNHSEDNS